MAKAALAAAATAAATVMVVALERGFYKGMIRDEGSKPFPFDGPGPMPKWMAEVEADAATAEPFAGKGDHDSDGKLGGSLPGDASTVAKGKGKGRPKAETVQPEAAEPFGDAPAPADAGPKGNGMAEALGADPDWVAKPVAI